MSIETVSKYSARFKQQGQTVMVEMFEVCVKLEWPAALTAFSRQTFLRGQGQQIQCIDTSQLSSTVSVCTA